MISSSSTETSRIALPASRMAMSLRWMNSMAPISTPAGRLADQQHVRAPAPSRGPTTIFCWLPPEKLAVRSIGGSRRADVEVLHRARPTASEDRAPAHQHAPGCSAAVPVIAEDRRSSLAIEGRDQPHALAVLGHVARPQPAHARAPPRPGRRRARSRALDGDACRSCGRACRPALSSSSDWPLPATPAMPTISPARTSNAHVRDAQDAAGGRAPSEVLDPQHRPRPALLCVLVDAQEQHACGPPSARRAARASVSAVLPRGRPRGPPA